MTICTLQYRGDLGMVTSMHAIVILLAAVVLGGCAAKPHLPADQYFRAASKSMTEGSYQYAIEQYRELLDQHPFSAHSEEAELRIAHAQFLSGACPEAVASLTDFQRRHPTSPHLAMVGYMVGNCYEQQMCPSDRDQSASQNAHAYYAAVIQQYPGSPFAELARERKDHCRETIAEQELEIASYYERRGNTKAAEIRLLDLVNRFPDTPVAGTALYRLGIHYRDHGFPHRAALAFAAVGRHHPESNEASDAQRELENLSAPEVVASADDPLQALRLESGRSRVLSLAQTTDVPGLERKVPGAALAPGALSGSSSPFGGAGQTGGIGSGF